MVRHGSSWPRVYVHPGSSWAFRVVPPRTGTTRTPVGGRWSAFERPAGDGRMTADRGVTTDRCSDGARGPLVCFPGVRLRWDGASRPPERRPRAEPIPSPHG